ncbi:hypothetical protein OAN307_c09340 [Octadecabacter antarcticus 307]|uniref:N-acetyltransferase domain-containing protein n=1 Tax=Octadecabacter antarcticus 307 TaxID=391626 RepID=M9R1Z0_9RHOB|nr:GNAT family N-acetyltransferase [Octadecabacter antarcticus]AGI66654.1 hypothetical protein OAN307_c09340 [Octadecabacter antarcticus 307]
MRLRPATMADARRLFDWRNDPATRAASVTTVPVSWEDHLTWMEASLSQSRRHLHIAEGDIGPLGSLRLDDCLEGTELSITLAPEARGRGLAASLLRLATTEKGLYLARIRPENTASRRAFEAAGFQFIRHSDSMDWFRKDSQESNMTPEQIEAKLRLIDGIEQVRSKNNVNWMNLLRVALKANPEATLELVRDINSKDNEVSELFAKLGE